MKANLGDLARRQNFRYVSGLKPLVGLATSYPFLLPVLICGFL